MDRHYENRTEESRDDYCTPPEVVAVLRQYGTIVLDPCSNAESMVGARRELYESNDGLAQNWTTIVDEECAAATAAGVKLVRPFVFVNFPYSNPVPWVEKIRQHHIDDGLDVILLMPARTETELFHAKIAPASACICFRKKRIHFWLDGVRSTRPTHPSMFVAFVRDRFVSDFVEVFNECGTVFHVSPPF
jgi:hypothetical protein